MKIEVWTTHPNLFIRKTRALLRSRGQSEAHADELLNGHFDGELVSFTQLSDAQFCAVEDMAIQMGLQYDGSQEETQQALFDFQPICEQMQNDGVEITPDSLWTSIHDLYAGLWEQLGDYSFGIVAGWLDRQNGGKR